MTSRGSRPTSCSSSRRSCAGRTWGSSPARPVRFAFSPGWSVVPRCRVHISWDRLPRPQVAQGSDPTSGAGSRRRGAQQEQHEARDGAQTQGEYLEAGVRPWSGWSTPRSGRHVLRVHTALDRSTLLDEPPIARWRHRVARLRDPRVKDVFAKKRGRESRADDSQAGRHTECACWASIVSPSLWSVMLAGGAPCHAGLRAPSARESEFSRARSIRFPDLAIPDRQHIVTSPAGNAVLAHERLRRLEHRLAAEYQGLGVVLGESEGEVLVLAGPDQAQTRCERFLTLVLRLYLAQDLAEGGLA